jgi:5-methyltetrahydrofolate--homocysteine methyltransferase
MKGNFPEILKDEVVGEEAQKLYNDARGMLRRIIDGNWLRARAVIGFFAANSIDDDDIEVYTDDNRAEVRTILRNLRQQREKASSQRNVSLTDFIAPKGKGDDYIGMFAVTTGEGIEKWVKKFEEDLDDYNAILLKAVTDRLAEALTERMHERVRKEFWGYANDEELDNKSLIGEQYKGIRPAPGYPACPEHTEKRTLWEIMDVEANTGILLTESCAMYPAASVSGWYFSHPESKYFGLGNISKDQVESYAERKDMSVADVERWLQSVLNYDV